MFAGTSISLHKGESLLRGSPVQLGAFSRLVRIGVLSTIAVGFSKLFKVRVLVISWPVGFMLMSAALDPVMAPKKPVIIPRSPVTAPSVMGASTLDTIS